MTEKAAILSLVITCLVPAGCSEHRVFLDAGDGAAAGDGATTGADAGGEHKGLPPGYTPWPCNNPGQACNAHDPCAINPVCGLDNKCWPLGLTDCEDGLACTVDRCLAPGLCQHSPSKDYCVATITKPAGDGGPSTTSACFARGAKKPGDPCRICAPDTHDAGTTGIRWKPANGGACDDAVACTRDDTCVVGLCKGTYYGHLCSDNLGCTLDQCDGQGGCVGGKLKKDRCLINGACYNGGAMHPSGSCHRCDVSKSVSSWTTLANSCHIDGKCYVKGDKHPGKCAECAPVVSTSAWTVTGSACLIDGACHKPGDTTAGGCATCAPKKDSYGWSLVAGLCNIDGTCFAPGTLHPGKCAACDPATSATSWTVQGTKHCLIDGVCHNKGDKDMGGCATCQPGLDKYSYTVATGVCKIDGACHPSGAAHPGGCASCAPQKSTTSWTASSGCIIDGTCHIAGAKHLTSCGVCDPQKSGTAWTVSGDVCLVGKECRAKGAAEPGGCGICAPQKSKTSWFRPAGCLTTHRWSLGFTGHANNFPHAIATDKNGNIYVTGVFFQDLNLGGKTLHSHQTITSSYSADVFVASFTPGGKFRWSRRFGGVHTDEGRDLVVDSKGNVYVTGFFHHEITFGGPKHTVKPGCLGCGADVFLASFTSDGKYRWSKNFSGPHVEHGLGLGVDASGNVFITGHFGESITFGTTTHKIPWPTGHEHVFLASLTSAGKVRWSNSFGGPGKQAGVDVALDAAGNVYLVGAFASTINFGGATLTSKGGTDVFVASLTSGGKFRWSSSHGGASGDTAAGVAVDGNANVFVTGQFSKSANFGGTTLSTGSSDKGFLASYTAAGKFRWSKALGFHDIGRSVDIDATPQGDVFVTGHFEGAASFGGSTFKNSPGHNMFVASYSTKGVHRWSRAHAGATGNGVVVDGSGGTIVAGKFSGPVDFGGGPIKLPFPHKGDLLLLKLSQ